jgi:hypothetical protein
MDGVPIFPLKGPSARRPHPDPCPEGEGPA